MRNETISLGGLQTTTQTFLIIFYCQHLHGVLAVPVPSATVPVPHHGVIWMVIHLFSILQSQSDLWNCVCSSLVQWSSHGEGVYRDKSQSQENARNTKEKLNKLNVQQEVIYIFEGWQDFQVSRPFAEIFNTTMSVCLNYYRHGFIQVQQWHSDNQYIGQVGFPDFPDKPLEDIQIMTFLSH